MPNRDKLEVGIIGGMRQDLSEHNAPPGTIVDALNVRFSAVGEVEARPGTDALSFATDCDVAYTDILTGTGEPTLARLPGGFFVGLEGYGFRYDATKARLHASASYANAEPRGVFNVVAREEIVATGAVPWPLSQAVTNGYVATVYSCGNGQGSTGPGSTVALLLVQTEDGTTVLSTEIASVSTAWVVKDGTNSTDFVLVTQSATTGINARVITTSATGATLGAATPIATLTSSTSYWAVCTWPAIGWVLVYQSAAAVVTIAKMTGVTVSATQTFAVTGTVPVSAYADTTHLYAGWRDNSTTPYSANARVYDTTLTLTSGGTVALETEASGDYIGPPLFGPSVTAATAMYCISRFTTRVYDDTTWIVTGELGATGADDSIGFVYGCVATSAPFGPGYIWAITGGGYGTSNLTERNVLLDFMGLRFAAASTVSRENPPVVALSSVATPPGTSVVGIGLYKHHLCPPAALSDGSLICGLVRLVRNEYQGATASGLGLAEWLTFAVGGQRQVATFGSESILSGWPTLSSSVLGTRYVSSTTTLAVQRDGLDIGFPQSPSIEQPVGSNGSGSLTSSALYQWRAVLERVDSRGRRWRSAPSPIAALTLGATEDTAALTAFANAFMLRAQTGVTGTFVMHFYRTAANGSTFYRCTPPQGAPSAAADGEFTYSDILSDALLTVREILYTDGGVFPNDPPASCRFVACSEDRVWLAGLWETEQLQSSKLLVPGEPPQFSDSGAFRVVLPEPCTGIAVQDGVLIAFSRSAVYAVQGGGPNDQGQGAWDSPRCITNSTGCISAPSILVTSVGVFFQSGQGIELLPRGMGEPVFVGMPVQDLMYSTSLGAIVNVISSTVVTTFRGRTARFVLDDNAGTVLVYDLDTQAWSRDSYGHNIGAIVDTDGGAVLATQAMSGNYGALVEQLDDDRDSIGNSPAEIASSIEWAELRPFGVAGQGRFTGAVALFDAKGSPSSGYRAGNATITLSVDRFSETGLIFNMNTLSGADYRKNTAANDVGTAGKLTLSTTVGGWRFVGWSVEIDDRGGGRRMGETEQG